ncbi:MAG: hypothetical protein RMX97_14500 [Nostoc sp. DedQUE11]|nr:hypothetical protein [Nostoc sp. DedQUE11]
MSDEFEQLRNLRSTKPVNYYNFWNLEADFSRPGRISPEEQIQLIEKASYYASLKEDKVPTVDSNYIWAKIEQENKDWWPAHCAAFRGGRGDILTKEYHQNLVSLTQDGPFVDATDQTEREKNWWALSTQPGATICWPIVLFWREFVQFEWNSVDKVSNETIARGFAVWTRRGHRGGCYFKSEQLNFYRDVYAPPELLP